MRIISLMLLLLISSISICQRKLIGVVNETQSRRPLEGVIVSIKNSDLTTYTNEMGTFEIDIRSNNDTVVFSKENYFDEVIVVGRVKKVEVGLTTKIKADNIEDSYGKQSTKYVTSSITKVEEKDFNKGVNNDIYQLIRGKVPGLSIIHDNKDPNGEPTILLRGGPGFGQAGNPLIVVDGIMDVSLMSVDPVTVQSVTVLKDSSAAAIYGSRASAGVIVIKTKKGKKE